MGICEREANGDAIQVVAQDSGQDLKIGDDKQGHGKEGVPAGGTHRDTLVHAGGWSHQRPLDHLS